jgi:predicted Zn-dependent protease
MLRFSHVGSVFGRWAVLAILVAATGCSVNPVTGKRQLNLMTEGQEVQLGAQSDEAIVAQYGLVDDPALASYVNDIGQRLVRVSHRPQLAFTIRLLDDPVVNAFALPGGFVYLTRGILAYFNSEATMAGVLGHEIGHVTARHGAQQYTQQTLFGLGLGVGSLVSETFAQYANLAGSAAQLLLLKFSRDDERQSDELGVQYGTSIGYDTKDMAGFFATLANLSAGEGRLPSWASTHPDPGERYETVLRLTAAEQAKTAGGTFAKNRDAYLRKLDGLPFGTNPREGFVEDGVFKHPELTFRFPVPADWRVLNGKSQVQVGEPNGKAAIIFTLAKEKTLEAAVTAFSANENLTVSDRRGRRIGGFEAVRLTSQATGQGGTLGVLSTFIQKDGAIYVFHGLSSAADFSSFVHYFEQTADGFGRLTEQGALNVKPVRLKIVAAPRDGTFAQLAAEHPIPELSDLDLKGLALLNGMNSSDRVAKGTLLKVLVQS